MSKPLVDTRTYIETPECVDLTFRVAGPGMRMGAFVLDFSIRIGIIYAVNVLLGLFIGLSGGLGTSLGMGVFLVLIFVIEWGYGSLFEGLWNGQTPGKRIFKLRVLKTGGYPIHFYDAAIRNLLRAADILPILYGFGLITMIATRRQQRLGDLVAGTMVVIEGRERFVKSNLNLSRVPRLDPLDCTRRFHVSDRTLEVVERLFDRRRALSSERREEIAQSLAAAIAAHLGFDLDSRVNTDQSAIRRFGRATWFLMRVMATFNVREEDVSPYESPRRRAARVESSGSLAT
jgi:uncharacterized RDD family membrane protein YckC